MGDVFYGNDDCEEMNEFIYKQDVFESMRRAQEHRALKKKKKNYFWKFFQCFRSFWFLFNS